MSDSRQQQTKPTRTETPQTKPQGIQPDMPVIRQDMVNLKALQRLAGNQRVNQMLTQGQLTPASGGDGVYRASMVPGNQSGSGMIQRDGEANENLAQELHNEGLRFYRAGQYQRAIVRFERARQVPGLSDEVNRDILFNMGRANLNLERFATAINYLEQYREMDGADTAGADELLNQAREGTEADAERILEREGASIPSETDENAQDRARALFDEAIALYERQQYRQAVIIFQQVREAGGADNPDVERDMLFNIARCNMHLRRYATAINYLERYLDMDGASVDEAMTMLREVQGDAGVTAIFSRLFGIGRDAYQAGNHDDAIHIFTVLLEIESLNDDERAQLHYNLGQAFFEQGSYDQAIPHYQAYLAVHPDSAEAQTRLRDAQEQAGGAPVEAEEATGAGE